MAYDIQGRKIPDTVQDPGSSVYYGKEPGSKYVQTGNTGFQAWSTGSPGAYGNLGLGGVNSPQAQAFFDALLRERLMTIAGDISGARRSAEEGLEERGMGQSSLLSDAYSKIGAWGAGQRQGALAGVQGLQFQSYLSALDFERELAKMKYQSKLNEQPWWHDALGAIGSVAPLIPLLGAGGAALGAGSAIAGVAGSNYYEV